MSWKEVWKSFLRLLKEQYKSRSFRYAPVIKIRNLIFYFPAKTEITDEVKREPKKKEKKRTKCEMVANAWNPKPKIGGEFSGVVIERV